MSIIYYCIHTAVSIVPFAQRYVVLAKRFYTNRSNVIIVEYTLYSSGVFAQNSIRSLGTDLVSRDGRVHCISKYRIYIHRVCSRFA